MFLPTFGVATLIVIIVALLYKGGKKFPLFGLFLIGCIIVFLVATCEQYEKDWPDEEERERRTEQRTREFHKKIKQEEEYYKEKWEREHPEEVQREKENEQWLKEHGYR